MSNITFTIAPHLSFNVMEEAPPPPPIFNLPPPPRPPDLPCPLEDSEARPLHHQSSAASLPVVKDLFQESCDINYVIDSRLYLGENLFTLLIVLVCSCILVGIVMTVGLLIYRRRSFFRRAMYKRDEMKNTETSQLEMSDRHVYANPSYAGHFEIGGMPFYLPSPPPADASAAAKMSEEESSSPPPIPPSLRPIIPGGNSSRGVAVDLLGNATDCSSSMPWYDNSSLRPQLLPSSRRLPLTQKTVSPAADNEVGGCMGPIYEDIDRMCSYRGYPPDSYYNLSGGSSPRNKSSNSEGSFDVKPSTPRSTTCTGPRSSNAASTASASAAGNNSIYYYSDTLRKGRVGSDSGISVDTPPPRLQSTIRGQNNRGLVQTEAVLTERKRLRRLHDTKV